MSSPLQRTTILVSTLMQNNTPTINIVQTFYDMYYGWTFTSNTSVIKLFYNPSGQQRYKVLSHRYAKERNVLYVEAKLDQKRYLYGVRLDWLIPTRNYMVWDWVHPLSSDITNFYVDSTGVLLYS